MFKFSSLMSVIILLILLTSFLTGCIDDSSKDISANNNDYAEDFEFTLLNGEKKNTSEYGGKIVLIDFTGVTCPYCVPQIFVLEEISNDYSSDDLVIISVFVWMYRETVDDINNLIDAYRDCLYCEAEEKFALKDLLREGKETYGKQDGLGLNWVFGYDDPSGTIYNRYELEGIPHLLILDKNGNIYYSFVGYTSYYDVINKLDELI